MLPPDERLAHVDLARRVGRFQCVAGWIRSLERCSRARALSPSVAGADAAHEFAMLHNVRNCGADDKLTVRSARGRVTSMVTRVRGRSLDELRVRGVQALHARLERLWGRFLPARGMPATELVFDRGGAFPAGAGIAPGAIASAIARLDPETRARFTQQSDAAERGTVTLLGYEPLSVGNPPRWHREAISGTEAPRRHWSRIDHLDTAVVGDHKLLWELNRHQYLLAPAFCWLLDKEARRFDLIQSHLGSWLLDNPPRQGVNWVSSLEVAYRAIAWCWLLWMLREAPWRPELRQRLTLSLEAHARHIERYLSTYFSPNTHLTGEALGLFYVGTVLSHSPHAQRWRKKGAAILDSAIRRQVYLDGVYFEQASQYHRYTAEIYLHYLLLANASGWSVPDCVGDTLGSLLAVLRTLASGSGRVPFLGDDDGGLLLPLDHRGPDDVRGLLLAGAVALQRPELAAPGDAPPSFAYWLCGIDGTDRLRTRSVVNPGWLDMYFARGGLAVLRDGWDADGAVSVIDAGPHGALSCGHSHADALAMTLALGRRPLFIDRGTLTYTGPERNEFRSTASHNTLEIDATSSVIPAQPFKWLPAIPPRAQGIVCSSLPFSSFSGIAAGHTASGRPSAHCRRVLHLRAGAWVIHDRGLREAARGGVLRWQLAPHLTAAALGASSVAIRNAAGVGVAAIFMRGASAIRIVTRDVSLRLGHRIAAQCLEVEVDASLEALTIVVPAGRDGSLATPTIDGHAEGGVVWSDAAGRHRVYSGALAQVQQLPAAAAPPHSDLIWRIDGADPNGADVYSDLIAALPAAVLRVPMDAQVVTDVVQHSGRMSVLANTVGRWAPLGVDAPRRG
jgi:hypothetical protein